METKECKTCNGSGLLRNPFIVPECEGDDVEECHDCDGKGMVIPDIELTGAQLDQIDLLHNGIFDLMQKITHLELEWDVSWIAFIADTMVETAIKLTGQSEMELYPYIDRDLLVDEVPIQCVHQFIDLCSDEDLSKDEDLEEWENIYPHHKPV